MSKNIFALESLRDWLRERPPETRYDYREPRGCLAYRYFNDRGVGILAVLTDRWVDFEYKFHDLPAGFEWVVSGPGEESQGYWTYGDALERAEALLAAWRTPPGAVGTASSEVTASADSEELCYKYLNRQHFPPQFPDFPQ